MPSASIKRTIWWPKRRQACVAYKSQKSERETKFTLHSNLNFCCSATASAAAGGQQLGAGACQSSISESQDEGMDEFR